MDRFDHQPPQGFGAWRAYCLVWSLLAGSLLCSGWVAAALTLTPGAMLGLMVAVGIPVGASVSAWSLVALLPRWAGLWTAVWAGILMNALSGLATLGGMWTLVAFAVVGATTPDLVVLVGERVGLRRRPARPAPPRAATSARGLGGLSTESLVTENLVTECLTTAGLVAEDLAFEDPHACRLLDPSCPPDRWPAPGALSTADLGRIWKVSGRLLELGLSQTEMAHLVQLRSVCLDELEGRDPNGFRHWVVSGRPWASGPTHYIGGNEETLPPEGA